MRVYSRCERTNQMLCGGTALLLILLVLPGGYVIGVVAAALRPTALLLLLLWVLLPALALEQSWFGSLHPTASPGPQEDHHMTAEGLERTWAVNVAAPFLLTSRLLPLVM